LILNRKRISKVDSISNILQYLIKMISGLERNGGEDRRSLSNVRVTINAGRKYRRLCNIGIEFKNTKVRTLQWEHNYFSVQNK